MKFSHTGTLTADDMQARLGKLTASNMWRAMDFKKSGDETKVRHDYMVQIVAERMTGVFVPHVVTAPMEHGILTQDEACKWYVKKTGHKVFAGQFLDHPTIDLCGATPDGFVDPDGLLEIKCPTTTTFLKWKINGGVHGVPEEHWPQMALQMSVTGRAWVDFCAYDPRMPEAHRGFIRRLERDGSKAYIKSVEEYAVRFLRETDELLERVMESEQHADMPGNTYAPSE